MRTLFRSREPVRAETERPAGGSGFDWAVAALSGWFIGGMWLDAWAHHEVPTALETFFTPWHGFLYTGFLAAAAFLAVASIRNRTLGFPWRRALPEGYRLSLLGVLIFMAGGVGDAIWHLLFGIEVDLEALLSPTHLLLALGGALIASGPLRAAWRRQPSDAPAGLAASLPMLLSLTLTLSVLTFFTEYANPFNLPWPARQFDVSGSDVSDVSSVLGQAEGVSSDAPEMLGQMLGVISILLQTGLMMGAVLLAVRRWELPFGAITLVFTLDVALVVFPHGYYLFVPGAALAGLAADLLLRLTKPSTERLGTVRVFAFAVPAILYALYFLTLAVTGGISWSVHLWSGAIVLAGAVGVLLSYLVAPPTLPSEVQRATRR
jgi:hypothetical protein